MNDGDPICGNPFFVLALPPDCGPMEVERAGTKLLGLLELGVRAAAEYQTPMGRFPRTAEAVREAMQALGDPNARLLHELWATVDPRSGEQGQPAVGPPQISWWRGRR